MKSIKYIVAASAVMFALAPMAFAQGVTATAGVSADADAKVIAPVGLRADVRADIKDTREAKQVKKQENRQEVKTTIQENRKETKEQVLENKNEIKTTIKENRKDLEAKRDTLKRQVTDKRMQLVAKFATQQTRIHQAAIKRLTKLGDRIDSRIAKSEAEKGVTLAEAKANMAIARADIAAAKTYLNGIAAQVTVITSASTTPQVALQSVKDLFAKSRTNLKTAQQALVDVISSIKLGLGMKLEATTTAEVEND